MPLNPDIHRSAQSSQFEELGQRYFQYWGDDALHLLHDEHREIRVAFCKLLKKIPKDGVVAFCGTGPCIAQNRDLDSTLIGGHLTDYPELIFADFSQDMLVNSFKAIQSISSTVASRSHLVIRDFSRNNIGAKFDLKMKNRIEQIQSVQDWDEFIKFLRNSVGVKEVNEQKLSEDSRSIDPRLLATPDTQEGLQFDKILHEKRPIQLIVANLLISGMFAVTEMEFRDKLAWLRKNNPLEMTDEKMVESLAVWHTIILELNETVGKDFIEDCVNANDKIDGSIPTIFLSVDDTVTYVDLEGFDRIRPEILKSSAPNNVTVREIDKTNWNHSHELIPHKHTVTVMVVSPTSE